MKTLYDNTCNKNNIPSCCVKVFVETTTNETLYLGCDTWDGVDYCGWQIPIEEEKKILDYANEHGYIDIKEFPNAKQIIKLTK